MAKKQMFSWTTSIDEDNYVFKLTIKIDAPFVGRRTIVSNTDMTQFFRAQRKWAKDNPE